MKHEYCYKHIYDIHHNTSPPLKRLLDEIILHNTINRQLPPYNYYIIVDWQSQLFLP